MRLLSLILVVVNVIRTVYTHVDPLPRLLFSSNPKQRLLNPTQASPLKERGDQQVFRVRVFLTSVVRSS